MSDHDLKQKFDEMFAAMEFAPPPTDKMLALADLSFCVDGQWMSGDEFAEVMRKQRRMRDDR